jgi:hypothetical protein
MVMLGSTLLPGWRQRLDGPGGRGDGGRVDGRSVGREGGRVVQSAANACGRSVFLAPALRRILLLFMSIFFATYSPLMGGKIFSPLTKALALLSIASPPLIILGRL